jgi:Holliday junction resolvasome RuvABC DNA-binding subunit
MASRETVSLSFKADIGDLKREIGSIPGITKTEAAKMVRELETGYNRAERAAKKAAQATKTSWSDVATGLSSVKGLVFDAGTAIVAFGQRMADLNNQLTDTATRTGLTIEQVAGLKLARRGRASSSPALRSSSTNCPR